MSPTAERLSPRPRSSAVTREQGERAGDEQPEVDGKPHDAELGGDVRGAVWDALRLAVPVPDTSVLARGCPPTPTPASGCALNVSSVTETSRERPLVAVRAPFVGDRRGCHRAGGDDRDRDAGGEGRAEPRAPEHEGDREHDGEQRHEARLGVREVEPGEQDRDQREHDHGALAPQPEADEEHARSPRPDSDRRGSDP